MDENKRKLNRGNKGRIIDLQPVLEEKERAERAEEKRRAKAERPPLKKRILSLFLVLIIVLAAVVLTVYWDRINFDAIRRGVSYIGTEQDAAGQTAAFEYEKRTEGTFSSFGKYLLYVSNQEAVVYDYSGNILFQTDVQLEAPALDVGGGVAVAYDIGGSNLVVFDERKEKLRLTLEDGLGIYSATLNQSGWLAVTSQKQNQKGCVTVYNQNMDKVFEYDASTRFVINAYVSEDCRYMIAHTLGQEDGMFVSQMVVYRLDSEEQYAEFAIEDAMVLSIGSINNQTLCIADNQAVIASSGGQVNATYDYAQSYLREYSDEGDGFAVLALNRYRAGTSGRLVTLGADGTAIGELEISDEILDLSAAGRYIAVLYADRLVIYNRDLTEYAVFDQPAMAESARMRSDGSVWLISSREISLLIP